MVIGEFEVGPDFQRALGRVVMEAAECEARLSDAVEAYIGGDNAWMVTRGLSVSALEGVLRSVAKDEGYASHAPALNDVIEKTHRLFEKRNAVVHGSWLPVRLAPSGGFPALRRRRNKKMLEGMTFTVGELDELANEFSALSSQIWLMLPGTHDDED